MSSKERARKIARLNDLFRRTGIGGRVMITQGVDAKGVSFVAAAVAAVREYDRFSPDNDPYGEHDFGAFEINDQKLFWKIDYYDKDCRYGSEDPCDPAGPTRTLTIMLVEEY